MFKYLVLLCFGVVVGSFYKDFRHNGLKSGGMSFTVLILLFFMGVGIGKDPELGSKILTFGAYGLVISFMSVVFSVLAVFLIMKISGSKKVKE